MSEDFERFKKQYYGKGPEKLDGYSKLHFEGLSDHEKEKAFDMLAKEMIAPGVGEWLFYLDPSRAKKLFGDYLSQNISQRFSSMHRVCYLLTKYTGDDKYSSLFTSIYPSLPNNEKEEAVWMASDIFSDSEKINFFKHIVENEKQKDPLISAADFLLRLKGIQNTKETRGAFYAFRNRLTSFDNNIKNEALKQLNL